MWVVVLRSNPVLTAPKLGEKFSRRMTNESVRRESNPLLDTVGAGFLTCGALPDSTGFVAVFGTLNAGEVSLVLAASKWFGKKMESWRPGTDLHRDLRFQRAMS